MSRELKNPDSTYLQVDYRILNCTRNRLNVYEKLILAYIISFYKQNKTCYASNASIMKTMGFSKSTVIRTIKKLCDKGLITNTPTLNAYGAEGHLLTPIPESIETLLTSPQIKLKPDGIKSFVTHQPFKLDSVVSIKTANTLELLKDEEISFSADSNSEVAQPVLEINTPKVQTEENLIRLVGTLKNMEGYTKGFVERVINKIKTGIIVNYAQIDDELRHSASQLSEKMSLPAD